MNESTTKRASLLWRSSIRSRPQWTEQCRNCWFEEPHRSATTSLFLLGIKNDRLTYDYRSSSVGLSTAPHHTASISSGSRPEVEPHKVGSIAFLLWGQVVIGKGSRRSKQLYQRYLGPVFSLDASRVQPKITHARHTQNLA